MHAIIGPFSPFVWFHQASQHLSLAFQEERTLLICNTSSHADKYKTL
jgi:hypothetical protein